MPHHAKFSLQCMWLVALPNPSKAVVVSFSRYLQYHGLHIQWESCSSRDVHQLGFNGNIMKHQHHPNPQKPSKLRKTPVIPCLNCLKASKVRVSTFGIPDFIMSMYSMQNTRVKQTLSWIQEHGGSLAEEPPDFWRSRMLKCATAQYWGTEYLKNNEKL